MGEMRVVVMTREREGRVRNDLRDAKIGRGSPEKKVPRPLIVLARLRYTYRPSQTFTWTIHPFMHCEYSCLLLEHLFKALDKYITRQC